MSPITHLVGSWLVAVATTSNPRDRKLVALGLFATSFWVAVKRGCSFVEIISDRADAVVVQVLRKWWASLVTACRR
jgi:hypothetical protein